MSGVYIIKFDIYPDIYKIGKSKDIPGISNLNKIHLFQAM